MDDLKQANLRDLVAATGLVILLKLDSKSNAWDLNHKTFIWKLHIQNSHAPGVEE